MKEQFKGATPSPESSEQQAFEFRVIPGREIGGKPAAYFVDSGSAEFNSAIGSLGGDEALAFYTNDSMKGRSWREMQEAAEKLKKKLSDPKVREKIWDLAGEKRELMERIGKLEQEYEELLEK